MAYYENANTVNVEFLKSSRGFGKGRVIKLSHSPQVPPQLYGRVQPVRRRLAAEPLGRGDLAFQLRLRSVQDMWGAFIHDCAELAERHPYTQRPSAGQVGNWVICLPVAAVFGFAFFRADAGNYGSWVSAVHSMLGKWVQPFQQAGCSLTLQQTRLIWIQIDIQAQQQFAQGYPVKQ